ncbi:MAG TPA: phage late control D family protein, partial [Byssovorax sp.]
MSEARIVELGLSSSAFDEDALFVRRVVGDERISRPFSFVVDVVPRDKGGAGDALVPGLEVTLRFSGAGGERRVHGLIVEIEDGLETETDARTHRLRVAPRIAKLGFVAKQAIYLDRTVPEIIQQKLEDVGLSIGADAALRLTARYPAREHVTQFKETDLAFVSRLAEHVGIAYHFEQDGDVDRVCFTDSGAGFADGGEARFRGRGERRDVFELRGRRRLVPGVHVAHDYNYRRPDLDVASVQTLDGAGVGGAVVEYGVHAQDVAEAQLVARARADAADGARQTYEGRSALPTLAAGARVRVVGNDVVGDVELLVVEVHHEVEVSLGGSAE